MVRVSGLGHFAAACWLAVAGGGCALAPPGPRGPLRPIPGMQGAMDFSLALSHAEAAAADGTRVDGTSDGSVAPIFPRRLEVRVSPASFWDIGADLGWGDLGANLRFGLPARAGELWSFAIAGGGRASKVLGSEGPPQASAWGRLELYPLVHDDVVFHNLRDVQGRLLLSAGLHRGTFYHALEDSPVPREEELEGPPSFVADGVRVVRGELRLETALGYVVTGPRGSILAAVEPYFVLDSSDPKYCDTCVEYSQSFGVVFVLRAAFFHPFERVD